LTSVILVAQIIPVSEGRLCHLSGRRDRIRQNDSGMGRAATTQLIAYSSTSGPALMP
jgi:hypothetical protein